MRGSENVSFLPSSKSLSQSPLWRLGNTVNKSLMDDKCTKLWQKLSAALKPQVSPDTFKRWFSAVKLVQATDESFTFRVPNNIYQFWIESNHMAALQAAIVHAFGSPRVVKFATASDGATKKEEEELPEISPKEFVRENCR